MSGLDEIGGVSNVFAFAVLLAVWLPEWGAILWLATSALPWKWSDEKSPWRWMVIGCATVFFFLAALGTGWVRSALIAPGDHTAQRIAYFLAMGEQLLLIAGVGWVAYARKRKRAAEHAGDQIGREEDGPQPQ